MRTRVQVGHLKERGGIVVTQILVPLDGSVLAEQAISCAVMLSRSLPSELILFRAVSMPLDVRQILDSADLQVEALMQQDEAEANHYLEEMADSLRVTGLTVHPVVQRGPAAESIVDYAGQRAIQQIVMATHGYSGLKRWRHGSVAERVLQAASIPVLLVRAREGTAYDLGQPKSCKRILVPLDGSELAEQVLPVVIPIALALGSEITVFRVPIVYTPGSLMGEWYVPLAGDFEMAGQSAQAYLDRVASRLKEQGIRASLATQIGAVANSIIGYAEANRVDLIAMCTHGRTGLARWALGSVADKVLRAGGIPMLLVRAK